MAENFYDKVANTTNNNSKNMESKLKAVDRALIEFLELRIQQQIYMNRTLHTLFMDCWKEITRNGLRHFQNLGIEVHRSNDKPYSFYFCWDDSDEIVSRMNKKLDITKSAQKQVDRAAMKLLKATISLAAEGTDDSMFSYLWSDISDEVKAYPVKLGFNVVNFTGNPHVARIEWKSKSINKDDWYAYDYRVVEVDGKQIEVF